MTHDTEVQVHDPDPPRAKRGGPANSPWRNEKIVARAKELWTDHTATQIASMLVREFKIDVSRNSIIGFLHREKLTAEHKRVVHPSTRGQVRPRVRRATVVNVQSINAAVQKINSAKAAPRVKPEPFVMACVEVEPRNLAFHDLEENDCRFAYGDNPFTFCGHPKTQGSSYCASHHRLCKAGVPQRRGGVSPLEFGKAKGGVFGRVA